MTPNALRSIIDDLMLAFGGPLSPELSQPRIPEQDPADDYQVVYVARIEPRTLAELAVELWLTDEGRVALGLDRRRRVAQRLGLKSRSPAFAGGHEPRTMPESAVAAILEAVAKGKIWINYYGVLGRIFSTKPAISELDMAVLARQGYPTDRLFDLSHRKAFNTFVFVSGAVAYSPWQTSS
jgi:hypothetical protein